MPNIKSAIKRVKTSEARNAQNTTVKSSMRTAVKKAEAAVATSDSAVAKEAFVEAARKLDKASAKAQSTKTLLLARSHVLLRKSTRFNFKISGVLALDKKTIPIRRNRFFIYLFFYI
ncbi:30S ribosomal protein S20 [Neobacillus sp. PS3-34]|uniref:30S ribosomal protein S20 n=1 Tax=Neobacillus sp. PS3-34 TaxID=3070678 RepID=UPI0035A6091E